MTLEQLLNKLIEIKCELFGIKDIQGINVSGDTINIIYKVNSSYNAHTTKSLNDLCSIDSGLWQFVCENELYIEGGNPIYDQNIFQDVNMWIGDYRYFLMLSSIQEDKSQFLLDNIKL